jgi:hypothetical protein
MLFLVEIKKQTRGFISSGWKTELRLLAKQNTDQSWSNTPNEDLLISEEIGPFGEGVLLMLNLNSNRQIQGSPELASNGIIQQLQKLSRLLEKSKQQQEEIDRWKSSLEIQSQELSDRQIALESQYEQLENLAEKYQTIADERREIDHQWEQLRQQREQMQTQQSSAPADLLLVLGQSQNFLDGQWRQLEQKKTELYHSCALIAQQEEILQQQRQKLYSFDKTIEQLKIRLSEQKILLMSKQQGFGRLYFQIQTLKQAQVNLTYALADAGYPIAEISEQSVDHKVIESSNLEQLQKIVDDLEVELKELALFVKDQEDELMSESESLEELYNRYINSSDSEKNSIEREILDREEVKKMLEDTLTGQQRAVRQKHYVLIQYISAVRLRQGRRCEQKIDLTTVLAKLNSREDTLKQYWNKTEQDITNLVQSIERLNSDYQLALEQQNSLHREIEQQEFHLEKLKMELNVVRTRVTTSEEFLEPMQNSINAISKLCSTNI